MIHGDMCVCGDLIGKVDQDYCDSCQLEVDVKLAEIAAETKRLTEEHERKIIEQDEKVA